MCQAARDYRWHECRVTRMQPSPQRVPLLSWSESNTKLPSFQQPAQEENTNMNQRTGQDLYRKAKTRIPGGTQLLSKRPEMFLPENWPAYYSRAKGSAGVGPRRQHVLRHELQRHRRLHPGRGRSGRGGGRHRGGQGRLDVDAQPAGGGGAGRSAVRAAPLGRDGALRPLRRRGDGDGRAHRAHPQRPRPGGLLRLPRLARLVPGRQPGRGPRPGRPSPARPRSGRRAAGVAGHGAAVPLQPCRGARGDRGKTRQRDRRRW